MKRKALFSLVLFMITLFPVVVSAQLQFDEVNDYLEYGEMSYQIEVGFDSYVPLPPAEARRVCEEAVFRAKNSPEESSLFRDALTCCIENGLTELAEPEARRRWPLYRRLYDSEPVERNGYLLLLTAEAAGDETMRDEAWDRVSPLLESGNALPRTVLAAVRNRSGNSETAYQLLRFYLDIYPREAELWFRSFLLTLNITLNNTVPSFLWQTLSGFQDTGGEEINDEMVETALMDYFTSLRDTIFLDELDRAVILDPENYQYRVAAAGFRSLVRWFSLSATLMMLPGLDLPDLFAMFREYEPLEGNVIREAIEKGLSFRPDHDVEIFLAAALYNLCIGNIRQVRFFTEQAVEWRGDMAKSWNALIFSYLLESISDETAMERNVPRLEDLLVSKLRNCGPDGYDYYVLASLQKYGVSGSDAEKRIQWMKEWAEKSIAEDDTFGGRLVLGNSLLLQKRYPGALKEYYSALERAEGDDRALLYTNRGALYLVTGNVDEGLDDVHRALDINPDSPRARALLDLYE